MGQCSLSWLGACYDLADLEQRSTCSVPQMLGLKCHCSLIRFVISLYIGECVCVCVCVCVCLHRVCVYEYTLLVFCLDSTPMVTWQRPGRPSTIKGGCLPPPLLLLVLFLTSYPLAPSLPIPLPLSPCGHGWPPLLYSPSQPFLASTILLTPLPMP